MNTKRFLRIAAVGILLAISAWILAINVHARSNLWMLEISEETALSYNQLCVVDEKGRLYSLSAWVPAPLHREKLRDRGVDVADYATMYRQLNYEEIIACTDAQIPVVTDDADLRHYYSADESVVSFREAEYMGFEGEHRMYSINTMEEFVYNAAVGPEGYGIYDLSDLEDGLYYVNPGGLVELKRRSE